MSSDSPEQQSSLHPNSEKPSVGMHRLSCTYCRSRKVKCSRVQPCSHCVRLGVDCQFPTRKRNVQRRPHRQEELLNRLARLEKIVGTADCIGAKGPPAASNEPAGRQQGRASGLRPNVEDGDKRTVSAKSPITLSPASSAKDPDPSSTYVSRDFWSNLCTEVEGLKQALANSSDSEDDDPKDDPSVSPESISKSGTLGSPPSHLLLSSSPRSAAWEPLSHPSPAQIRHLGSVYWTHVDPCTKILHRPTVRSLMESFADSPSTVHLDKETESLFFAIYFAAVTALKYDEAGMAHLAEDRATLISRYRQATEMALSRADYLENTRLEPLQAFAIYLTCLRVSNEGRAAWALFGTAVRLAYAINLHDDNPIRSTSFSPYESEMRRRLWWQMSVLEVRGTEDRGSASLLAIGSCTTQMLTNINDDDFGPHTSHPLIPSDGPTDATCFKALAAASRLHPALANVHKSSKCMDDINAGARALEAEFIDRMDPNHWLSVVTARTVRIIVLKIWLLNRYPIQENCSPATHSARVSREDTLRAALAIIELQNSMREGAYGQCFRWWHDTYVQWHPLAVALAELCVQTVGQLPDRAWSIIEAQMPVFRDIIADTRRGRLWKPIRKLYRKARAARLEAHMKGLSMGPHIPYQAVNQEKEQLARVQTQQQYTDRQRTYSFAATSASSSDSAATPVTAASNASTATLDHMDHGYSGFTTMEGMPSFMPAVMSTTFIQSESTMDWTNFSPFAPHTLPQGQFDDEGMMMDWSNWNEFVTETTLGGETSPPGFSGL